MVRAMTRTPLFAAMVASAVIGACKKDDKPAIPEPPRDPAAEREPAEPTEPTGVLRVEGFATPESVVWDADADLYLVSNINGSPFEADGNGFISQVSPDGALVELKWIDGASDGVRLDAPKGMVIDGDTLFVADIDRVRMFDRKTGAPTGEVELPGSTFVNGLAARDGVVWATDSGLQEGFEPSGTDALWRIAGGKAEAIVRDPNLARPNGLTFRGDSLWMAPFGGSQLHELTPAGKPVRTVPVEAGQLDGLIALADGRLAVSSWEASAIFIGDPDQGMVKAIGDVAAPADLGYDARRERLLVPLFQADAIEIHPVPAAGGEAPSPVTPARP
jgi:sugar lactone lactonase YvrE